MRLDACSPICSPRSSSVHFAIPGTIGALKYSFFPEGGLVAEQTANVGSRGQGRLADIGPALDEFGETPSSARATATRRVEFGRQNAQILDNQWLSNLLETGLVGTIGWAWLFWRAIRRSGTRQSVMHRATGGFPLPLPHPCAAFAIGMFTFDAFAFVQVTLIVFILIAVGAAAAQTERRVASQSARKDWPARVDAALTAICPRLCDGPLGRDQSRQNSNTSF